MIISQTPLRISFVGGGTDLPDYYKEKYGAVLSTAINKYIYVIIKKRFDKKIVINYLKKEIVSEVDDVKHELIRESLKMTGIKNGVEITTMADIPLEGTGLGSSSSVTAGLLNAMYAYQGRQIEPSALAANSCKIEIDLCEKPIGKQDQYAAVYGGVNEIKFYPNEDVEVLNIYLNQEERTSFDSNLLLFYTGKTRKSSSILSKQKRETKNKKNVLTLMKNQVRVFRNSLEEKNFDNLGILLDKAWNLKRKLVDNISNVKIDQMYQLAKDAGALGGKISGAGGGGFLLLYVPRNNQVSVRKALEGYIELPFNITPYGSKIIFNMERG